jgi:hypothetical protein
VLLFATYARMRNFAKLFCAGLKAPKSELGGGALEFFGGEVGAWGLGGHNKRTPVKLK